MQIDLENSMKKFLSIITTILICTSCVYAAEITPKQSERLNTLGIMMGDPDGNMRLNDNITRAEAAKMICMAVASQEEIDNTPVTDIFTDVNDSHWAYKYICYAKKSGFVNGDENGDFNPEANITNSEIAKTVVCLLGYDAFAETSGGYPAGYIKAATRFGITKGLVLIPDSPAVRNDFAIMMDNALDIPLMVESEKTEGEYVIMDGKNGVSLQTLMTKKQASK